MAKAHYWVYFWINRSKSLKMEDDSHNVHDVTAGTADRERIMRARAEKSIHVGYVSLLCHIATCQFPTI